MKIFPSSSVSLTEHEGFTYTEGGVCAAEGFLANGLNCGLNPDREKNDLALLYSTAPCATAAVYTTNKVQGAPIPVTRRHLDETGGMCRAVIANSKNANTCNADGEAKAEEMCRLAAEALQLSPEEVLVASTGVIGQILPIEPIRDAVALLAAGLRPDGNKEAAYAIMTTDTVKKENAITFHLGDTVCHLGGMAKGSGMIHPNMATTLNFITTDAAISPELLQCALSKVVKTTYNCLSIDGDTSTNDMVLVMANGLAGNEFLTSTRDPRYPIIEQALAIVMGNLTRMLAKDGEGATKLLTCTCSSAPDEDTAIIVAKSVIRSPLLKCAMFGEDANWGRVLCAIGYAEADFAIDKVDVDLVSEYGRIAVCREGSGVPFSEETAAKILSSDEITIDVRLNQGEAAGTAWGCDLTYDYVKINGDYRS